MGRRRTALEREAALREKVQNAETELNQYKARLQQLAMQRQQAEKKVARRERDRLLYTIGGLAALANIAHIDKDALLGAFLSVAVKANDPATVQRWTLAGSMLHSQRAATNAKSRAAQS